MSKQIFNLKNGIEVLADISAPSVCKFCGQKIYWAVDENQKKIPINTYGLFERFERHFCSKTDNNK